MKIVFGPIYSKRFGKSLGIDLSPNKKQCNFDCLYCELKREKRVDNFYDIVSIKEIKKELKEAVEKFHNLDVITITANGEPTLYPYLKEVIVLVNSFKKDAKSLILTNSSTIYKKDVQDALLNIDIAKFSLDSVREKIFKKIDRTSVNIEDIKRGLLEFRKIFSNLFIIEILLVKGINDNIDDIRELNDFLLKLNPHRVDFGTFSRPPAYNIKMVEPKKILELASYFDPSLNLNILLDSNFSAKRDFYTKEDILRTLKLRPLTPKDIDNLFDQESLKNLEELLNEKKIVKKDNYYILS